MIAMEKAAFYRKKTFLPANQTNLRKELVKCYICSIVLYGAD
jgi:hypothetical protein